MKKLLFAAAAIVAMASCATDDVVSRPAGAAIEFNDAFVENATRANDIAKDNLSQFNVYGSVTANNTNGFIFTDQLVEKNGDNYTYTPAQYWIPAASYKFTAFASLTADQTVARQWSFAPAADAANGVISFNNEVAQANQDLVYAYADCTTPETIASKPAPVAFTFNHMLSRVQFTITNGFTAGSNIKLDITNLTITDAHANGTLEVADGVAQTWAVGTDVFGRNFGSTTQLADNNTSWTTEHFYLIPTKATYNVTFDVTLWQAGVNIDTYTRTATVDLDMSKGMSYNIKATLNASNTAEDGSEIYPIEFTVTDVNEWQDFGDVNATVSTPVSTAAELAAAVANGEPVALAANITLTGDELVVAEGKEANIDLNGNVLTVAALDPINNYGKMTISNGKIVANNTEDTRRCIYNRGGEMIINNVEFVQTYDQKGAAINNEGKMTINNATVDAVYYSIWTSGANAETTINGGSYTTTNNVELRDTWSYAVIVRNGAKLVVNGGTFVGNHGVIAVEDNNSTATLNAGTFNCTATYTGNSDWVFYASGAGSKLRYNAAMCTLIHATKSADACCTTENGGVVEAF